MPMSRLDQHDPLDRNILFHLQENSRQSTASLSKKLQVARSTIHERIARLERDGVIMGYTAVLKPEPEYSKVQALIFLQVEQSRIGRVTNSLQGYPEIKSCFALTGEFDLYCSIEAAFLEDLDEIIVKISTMNHVLNTHSKIVLSKKFERMGYHTGQLHRVNMEQVLPHAP